MSQYKKLFLTALFSSTLFVSAHAIGNAPDTKKIIRAVNDIERQYQSLGKEIEKLKQLLGIDESLGELTPIAASKEMTERVSLRTEDGIEAFEEKEYEEAKEKFQEAWEGNSESYITNYNLALAYKKLGNASLAKKMFKAAYDVHKDLPNADMIKAYLEGKDSKHFYKLSDDALTEEEKHLQTEVINLQKEGQSYMSSKTIPFPVRMKFVMEAQHAMLDKIDENKKLKREFYVAIADVYATFEWYKKALALLEDYEGSMDGKVLPNGYHAKKLQYRDKEKKQLSKLAVYKENTAQEDIKDRLSRDMRELEIFGAQMQEFVVEAEDGDADFEKICQRLKEYRWGNKANRHVIVINKYHKLLFSSLEGTLPIERYRDIEGKPFLKNITFLGDEKHEKKAQHFPVDLSVNGKTRSYVVMYTYVPKHEAFIVVRIPREDLN